MSRDRIDWATLQPLPRKKRDGATREDAAERLFHAKKAKHRGRNHVHNWKRREMGAKAKAAARDAQAQVVAKVRRHIDAVRSYWRGEAEEHP
jgi:nicotinamide mononucleotide adenylyltransferase